MRILRANSLLLTVFVSFLLPVLAQDRTGLTARDYYKELYAAGGFDHVAGGRACFQDDPKVDSFFILRESKSPPDNTLAAGAPDKLPKSTKEDFLMVRGYAKGIPWRGEEFLEKDDESWISDQRMLDEHTLIRIRFNLNWQTLRYKYAVEILNMDSTYRTEEASFGHCEKIPGKVQEGSED